MNPADLPQATVYSLEKHEDGASGHRVLFLFPSPNVSLSLVLLQLRCITTVQKISAPISVVLETVELIKPI